MLVNASSYQNSSINAYKQNISETSKTAKNEDKSLEETLKESAVSVSISMNAQIVLFSLNSSDTARDNVLIQGSLEGNKDMFNYLAGKEDSNGFSLKDIGYEGKAITELSPEEAEELLEEEGFFGIEQTSNRVADFVFSFAGNDVELLKEGREGIIRGFEEAQILFGNQLPEISFKTQEKTLELIDAKINSINNGENQES
ncbi:MAG: hydrogenase-4 component G [Campylobacteraceae bacterium]|nr:hydrogenase-4 component G [Campylobacteraceae bacterium]